MKKVIYVLILFLSFAFFNFAFADEIVPQSDAAKAISKFKYPPIDWKVPEVGVDLKRIVLKNGMILYLKEDHEFPIVKAYALIRTGDIYETVDSHGLAELTGTVMRTGGTNKYPKDELNKKIEFLAASIETDIGTEYGSASLFVLSDYLNDGFELLSQVLRWPVFAPDQLDLAKSDIKEEFRRKNDMPGEVAIREYYKAIYPDHPYGWELKWGTIKKITRDDLIQWHNRYYHPNNIMLAVYGDFKTDELLKTLDKYFGDWQRQEIKFPEIPMVEEKFNPQIKIFPKELNQTYMRIGHIGVKFDNPDKYALTVMNFILGGGGFNSRLMEKVRSDKGLAYEVWSYFDVSQRDLGNFRISCKTKTDSTYEATDLILKEIRKIREEEVSPQELKLAKDSIINSYIFNFEDPFSILENLMTLEYFGRPTDYYQKYISNIEKVTAGDVLRVAKKYLNPQNLTFIFVGNADKFKKALEKFGKVQIFPLEEFKE